MGYCSWRCLVSDDCPPNLPVCHRGTCRDTCVTGDACPPDRPACVDNFCVAPPPDASPDRAGEGDAAPQPDAETMDTGAGEDGLSDGASG
jgi:hypothetical protein